MKMEELNKNQIVLLVLLVSFVTSIATGIVTVTLLDQAPPGVTQTINRIVERTVEKVVPGAPPPPAIKEVPVIVTEEELILKVINGTTPGVVRVLDAGNSEIFVTGGFIISAEGMIVGSAAAVAAAASTTTYQAVLADGNTVPLTLLASSTPVSELSFFKPTTPVGGDNKWSKLTFAKTAPAIGQTIVVLGYSDRPDINVSVGIVSSLLSTSASTSASSSPLIVTNAASAENQGGPLMNIKGEVVGMSRGASLAVSVETITAALKMLK